MRAILLAALLFITATPALAQAPDPESDRAAIHETVASWYSELRKGPARRPWRLHAPGFIDGGPAETELHPEWRAMGPTLSNELAARSLAFAYEITGETIETKLAKVRVWERGYFYAFAAEQTYENCAATLFVLEKQDDGRWLILAHAANSVGFPDSMATKPLPDMRPLWEAQRAARPS